MTVLGPRTLPFVPALIALAVIALTAGGGPPRPAELVRVLQMSPTAFITGDARSPTFVRAALQAPEQALPPPMQVPAVGSVAVGAPNGGALVKGLLLPGAGPDWQTWDPVLGTTPNRADRRWGTDRLLAFLLFVLRDYRLANPGAPPVAIGDLSRPSGGPFGSVHGGLGHASHQNGLDVDVYYPRLDRAPRPPARVDEVDRRLAQDLVSRFVAAGAQHAFVGLRVGLGGPAGVVQAIEHHDDHVHVRIANVAGR